MFLQNFDQFLYKTTELVVLIYSKMALEKHLRVCFLNDS